MSMIEIISGNLTTNIPLLHFASQCPPEPFFHCPSKFVRICDSCAIPAICSSGLNSGLPCNLLSADDEDEGGCIDIEDDPEEQDGLDGVEGNATQLGSGGGSLCKALDSRSCPDTLCRRWRCEVCGAIFE